MTCNYNRTRLKFETNAKSANYSIFYTTFALVLFICYLISKTIYFISYYSNQLTSNLLDNYYQACTMPVLCITFN